MSRVPPLVPLALASFAFGFGSCAPSSSMTIVSWNVDNLFDELDDPSTLDDLPTTTAVQAKLSAIAAVLIALDPDVVCLQEVENAELLDRLADGPLAERGYAHRVLIDGNDPRGIDVGVLSRQPIVSVRTHRDDRFPLPSSGELTSFSRDVLEVELDLGPGTLILFVVHLRSQIGGDEADARRLAESEQIRRLVEERVGHDPKPLLVAGDFNDVIGSPTLDVLLSPDLLVDLGTHIRPADRWTYRYEGELEQLDHLLGTSSFDEAAAVESVEIVHGPVIDAASDHAPVMLRLRP